MQMQMQKKKKNEKTQKIIKAGFLLTDHSSNTVHELC